MTRLLLIAMSVAMVAGCARIELANEAVKSAKDAEAKLAIQAPCLTGLGAGGRVWTFRQQAIAAELCNYMVSPSRETGR